MADTTDVWNRLEIRSRSEYFKENLRNQIYDPYWMLCRQWQTGEFAASDNGSPAEVRVEWRQHPLERLSVDGNPNALYRNDQPLEAAVERVKVRPGIPLRMEMGRHLLRMLRSALGNSAEGIIQELKQAASLQFQLPADERLEDRQRHAQLLSNRSLQSWVHAAVQTGMIDGGALYDQLRSGKKLSDFLAQNNPQADQLGTAWAEWFDEQYNQPPSEQQDAWQPERLEYRFSTKWEDTGQAELELGAQEYHEGHLDWYSFQLQSSGGGKPEQPLSARHLLPTEVNYPGMPAARWWEVEDGKVNLLAIEAGATQTGRLALVEFALMYSNDWFMLPLRVPVGGLLDVAQLSIRNVFGQWSKAKHYTSEGASQSWSFFALKSGLTPGSEHARYLLLPPTVVDRKESQPLEEVYLARDEMANMVWAIEQHVPDGIDGRLEGNTAAMKMAAYLQELSDEATGGQSPPQTLDNEAKVQYRLATEVPEYWIPFKAVPIAGGDGAIQLQRAAMPRVYEGLKIERIRPRTSLLRPGLDGHAYRPFFLPEEEVPKAGVRVSRKWQRARWYQGRAVLWSGFRKQNGRGQGNSGLRFDSLREKP